MTVLADAWVASQLGPRHIPGEERVLGLRLPRLLGQPRPERPQFYLGCPEPSWLTGSGIFGTPQFATGRLALFPSAMRIHNKIADPLTWTSAARWEAYCHDDYAAGTLPIVPYALDSGAFSEITKHGQHRLDVLAYVMLVADIDNAVPGMQWAAGQDFMCEDPALAKTGATVEQHQRWTIDNHVAAERWWAELHGPTGRPCPIRPTVQGRTVADYLRHRRMYEEAGVNLAAYQTVGVGSVCRLQSTGAIDDVLGALAAEDLWLHGFGVKTAGLSRAWRHLVSADSQAWSYDARYAPALPGHTHRSCVSCPEYALREWDRIIALIDRRADAGAEQTRLHVPTAAADVGPAPYRPVVTARPARRPAPASAQGALW